jgi:hypothetical protein
MIAPALESLARDLLAGSIAPTTAGKQLTALAEGVAHIETAAARREQAARDVVLIAIGLGAAVQHLDDALPRREVKPVDGAA